MSTPDQDAVARALAETVQDALARGETVEVPGLGTFSVDHQPSTVERQSDGTVALRPPQKTVQFDAPS